MEFSGLNDRVNEVFVLGRPVSLSERFPVQSPQGVRLCFHGVGHAHGISGMDDEGHTAMLGKRMFWVGQRRIDDPGWGFSSIFRNEALSWVDGHSQ
jgi:hypothetical protein